MEATSYTMIGLPKLGASARRMFRGMTVSNTCLPKYSRASAGDLSAERLSRASYIVSSTPSIPELLVDVSLHEVDGIEKLGQSFERVVLALHRNQQCVSCRKHVDGDQAQRRRAVDQDVVVAIPDRDQTRCALTRSRFG